MRTRISVWSAFSAGLLATIISYFLYGSVFSALHKLGISFDTPYTENPFQPFDQYRALMAVTVGVLTVGLLQNVTWQLGKIMIGAWLLSWGMLLIDAGVRSSQKGGPTFAYQMSWYLLPILTMALTFAAVLALVWLSILWQRRRSIA